MRTVHCSGHLGGGGSGCLPRGCLPREGMPRGVSARGRVSAQGGCLLCVCPGGCLPGMCVSAWAVYTPPSVDRMTDACENITFPQLLLRTINITFYVTNLLMMIMFRPKRFDLCFYRRWCRRPVNSSVALGAVGALSRIAAAMRFALRLLLGNRLDTSCSRKWKKKLYSDIGF